VDDDPTAGLCHNWSFASLGSLPCFTCDDEALALLSDDAFWMKGGGGVCAPHEAHDGASPPHEHEGVVQGASQAVRTRRCKAHPPTSPAVDRRQVKVRRPPAVRMARALRLKAEPAADPPTAPHQTQTWFENRRASEKRIRQGVKPRRARAKERSAAGSGGSSSGLAAS
jgi:hypothetical protein